ncbi:hypothetical protein ES708_05067 [subsurface metagenome]
MQTGHDTIDRLNHPGKKERLRALSKLMEGISKGEIKRPPPGKSVNNHIHTFYSFSPYSPTMAVWLSNTSGLCAAGIMDHDSISGAEEFIEAGKITGLATTTGLECRADFSATTLKGKLINHPNQRSLAYIALHGIPYTQIEKVKAFFAPLLKERNKRNRLMVDRLNSLINTHELALDFTNDVLPLSKHEEGGSVTERHILFALALKLTTRFGTGNTLFSFLEDNLLLRLDPQIEKRLLDSDNRFYSYDLLGALKSGLLEKLYIDAEAECHDIGDILAFTRIIGAIAAYSYLGDITLSVTGDKKSRKYEDSYLDLLFSTLNGLGFQAVTYMPTRNTPAQLKRVKEMCRRYSFFEISGEDINSPRQSFVCPLLAQPDFRNLIDSTWALAGHEEQAAKDLSLGMFSAATREKYPGLDERIQFFKAVGLERYLKTEGKI